MIRSEVKKKTIAGLLGYSSSLLKQIAQITSFQTLKQRRLMSYAYYKLQTVTFTSGLRYKSEKIL